MKILCSGLLLRYPLGGLSWHHLQYLVGLRRAGHEVVYFEEHGWESSCYDAAADCMTSDPGYGLAYLAELLRPHGLEGSWCYLAEDGTAYGMPREALAEACSDCDLYLNLGNINSIPELALCRRRVLVDTDPVFTQIDGQGMGIPFSSYHVRFTFGENVHCAGCDMPTGGTRWLPTRQPVVLDLWPAVSRGSGASFTTVTSWDPIGDHHHEGRVFGGKAREFTPFFSLPRETGEVMEMAVNLRPRHCDPAQVSDRLTAGGWRLVDPGAIARTPDDYRRYVSASGAEFGVAKHGYVATQCGWFSERSTAYLASGRPVVVQDTGFSRFLPCGAGLLPFRNREEAVAAIRRVGADYDAHAAAARALVEEYFEAGAVLDHLLERSL